MIDVINVLSEVRHVRGFTKPHHLVNMLIQQSAADTQDLFGFEKSYSKAAFGVLARETLGNVMEMWAAEHPSAILQASFGDLQDVALSKDSHSVRSRCLRYGMSAYVCGK
jgi:hypothetical protein